MQFKCLEFLIMDFTFVVFEIGLSKLTYLGFYQGRFFLKL